MTSDEYPVYADVIRDAYGARVTPPRPVGGAVPASRTQ